MELNLFGTSRKVFSLKELKTKLSNGVGNDFKEAKDYFVSYYAKSLMNGFYYYEPVDKTDRIITNIDEQTLNQVFAQLQPIQYVDANANKNSFDLKKWFRIVYDSQYSIGFDPLKSLFYNCENTDKLYINMAKSFLHKERKSYNSFSDDIKNKVDKILFHLKNVWNSGNEKCYDYTLNHLAYACTGRKMKTCVFLKSGEGTGKSIILEFIIKHVIGEHLGLVSSRSSQLAGFNYQLLGKLIVVLEELPTGSKNEWFSLSDILKQLITGSKLEIEKKHSDMMSVANYISLYILTNNDNTIKFGKDMRRYFMCDISHDYVGDNEYFKELSSICENRNVGEAFFMYLLERVESNPNFDESLIPLSENKLSMKSQNLTTILKFVKDEYIKKNLGLESKSRCGMISLKDFHTQYMDYSTDTKIITNLSQFHIEIKKDIQIIKTCEATKNKTLHIKRITPTELLNFYKEKGFWIEGIDNDVSDEMNDIDNGIQDEEEINKDEIIKQKDKVIENLMNEIQLLKQKLNEMNQPKEEPKKKVVNKKKVINKNNNFTIDDITNELSFD
jgi:hypothetical protein